MFHSNSSNEGSGDGNAGSSSFLDSGFDYRSLLPTRSHMNQQEQQSTEQLLSDEQYYNCTTFLPELTWRERCIGCATCMIAGYLLSMGSFWRIADLIRGNSVPFVLNETVGNLIALAGSCFFTGPTSQMQRMFHPKRRIATSLYLGSLFLTLLVAFLPGMPGPRGLILLVLMLAQYVAVTWYCLSYIPFAQEAVANFIRHCWQRNEY